MLRRCAIALTTLLLPAPWLGCDASDPTPAAVVGESGPLADNGLWEVVPQDADPFEAEDPDAVEPCSGVAYGPDTTIPDELWFDVTTLGCNYLTVRQPAQMEVHAGAWLLVWIFHFSIVATEGTFTLRVAAGDPPVELWSRQEPVPAEGGLYYEWIPIETHIPAGTPIWYHVSNHGQNTWSLIALDVDYEDHTAGTPR